MMLLIKQTTNSSYSLGIEFNPLHPHYNQPTETSKPLPCLVAKFFFFWSAFLKQTTYVSNLESSNILPTYLTKHRPSFCFFVNNDFSSANKCIYYNKRYNYRYGLVITIKYTKCCQHFFFQIHFVPVLSFPTA